MANQAIAPAPTQGKQVTSAPATVKLPEAFQAQPEPSAPAPSMDAFEELEQIDAGNPAPDSRPPKRKLEPEKPESAKSDSKAAEKTPETSRKPAQDKPKEDAAGKEPSKADEKAPEPTDPLAPDDPSKKFQLASELRRDYRRLHAENEKLAARLKEVANGKPEVTEERKLIQSKLDTLEKRNKELEEEISYRDYTKSTEFQEKFKAPFEKKLASVYRQVADLYVRDSEGNERAATREDFDRVLEAPQSDARRIAKEVFGDEDFREVLQYRRELNELQQNADMEMKNWREKAKERETNAQLEQRKQMEQAEGIFRKSMDTYTEKYPEWFGKVENDDELNKALENGFTSVDKSQDRNIPLEQRLDLLAAARLKAASFPRLVITNRRLVKKVAELEQALKDYQKSEPGEGQGQRSSPSVGSSDEVTSAMDEIDELERRNPVMR